MFDVFKISFGEYKKIFSKKSVYITLGILFLFFLMGVDQMVKAKTNLPLEKSLLMINMMFFGVMQFIIMFRAAAILPEEFKFGTSSYIFTSTKSRTQILLSKILAFGLFGITIGFTSAILILYYMAAKNLPIYYSAFWVNTVFCFIYSWFIGNYFLFCSVIFKSTTVSFITGLFFLYLLDDIFLQLANKIHITDKFLDFIPFYGTLKFLTLADVNFNKIMGLLIGGVVFFILSAVIFEKQDLV